MPNELDELTDPVSEGQDVRVINKQIPVKVGPGSTVFQVMLWVLGIIPGAIFLGCKIRAERVLSQLQQKLQSAASTVDNYLEQRVIILENLAALINKEMDFERSTLERVIAYRGGINPDQLNEANQQIENVNTQIKAVFERYPELQSIKGVEKAMRDNDYLQREITAAREAYNDVVREWNQLIFVWPSYKIVAAKKGYTTRIPFSTTAEMRTKAREVLF